MPNRIYTAQQHKRAFEVFYETRNWSEAARSVGTTWETMRRWGAADYRCAYGCPWHGFEELIAERERMHQARLTQLNSGNFDPVSQEKAMRSAVLDTTDEKPALPAKVEKFNTAMQIVRSDLERIAHWEYLWSKVFFSATGIVTDWREYRGMNVDPAVEEELRDALRGGLHATSLEQCVRMLKTVQDQIDTLQGASRRDPGVQVSKAASIEDLRKMKKLIEGTPDTKLRTMLTVIENEDAAPDTATG